MVGEPVHPTLTEKAPGRGRKKGPDLGVLVETTVVGLFGLVAVATSHEHWLKDKVDVLAITGPLNAWIDQLPAKTLKRVEQNLAPCLLVVGLATVVGPDVVLEMRIRAANKNARRTLPEPQGRGQNAHTFAERPAPAANGAGGRSEGGWYAGIPTSAPIGSEFDV